MADPPTERNPMAEAMAWVSRITTISIGMVIPILVGHFADRVFGTQWLILVGTAIGMILAFRQLLAIANRNQRNRNPPNSDSDRNSTSEP